MSGDFFTDHRDVPFALEWATAVVLFGWRCRRQISRTEKFFSIRLVALLASALIVASKSYQDFKGVVSSYCAGQPETMMRFVLFQVRVIYPPDSKIIYSDCEVRYARQHLDMALALAAIFLVLHSMLCLLRCRAIRKNSVSNSL